MAVITRAAWDAYSKGVSAASDAAMREMAESLGGWLAKNPGASIAEAREEAQRLYGIICRKYGAAASAWSAWFYDETMKHLVPGLDAADVLDRDFSEEAAKVAHYQAQKLGKGDRDGFLVQMSKSVRDACRRSAAETVIEAVHRDRREGVRYARVLTGQENCTFCVMLASRGFTYWSKESAGDGNRWHRNCDCRVVAGTETTQIEGYDIGRLYDLWTGMRDIDNTDGMTWEQKKAARQKLLDENPVWD